MYTSPPERDPAGPGPSSIDRDLYTSPDSGRQIESGPSRLEHWVLRLAIGLPFGWLFLFLLMPTLLMLVYSFWTYTSFGVQHDFTFDNYKALLASSNLRVFANTLEICGAVTATGLVLGYCRRRLSVET